VAAWSEDHVAAIWFLNSKLWFSSSCLNWRSGGALRWKVKIVSWEGQGVVCGSWHLQGCSPRLYWLKTDGLTLVSKYSTYRSHAGIYGPSKPSSLSPTVAWLTPTASLVGLGEKLGTDPRVGQPVCFGLCLEPFFSGVVGSIQICRRLTKGCYMWIMWDMYGPGPYADWAFKTCGVLVRFSPAGCTSIQIVVTLGYE
jgi:hypothetical protein